MATAPAPAPSRSVDDANVAYQNHMSNYSADMARQGYSSQQIAAMSSPWAQAHKNMNDYWRAYKIHNAELTGGKVEREEGDTWGTGYSQADLNAQTNSESLRATSMAQQFNEHGFTTDPNGIQYAGYVPGWNTSMSMAKKFEDQVNSNSKGFNRMRDEATTYGPSSWARAEKLRQAELSKQARDKGAQSVGASTAAASDALAAQGGLSSGARERIAEGGAKNYVGMQQGVNTQALNNDLSIGTTDETNKLSMLSNVASQENQRSKDWMGAHQQDIAANTAETVRLNAYNQHLTDQKNAAYAAGKQAEATGGSGK